MHFNDVYLLVNDEYRIGNYEMNRLLLDKYGEVADFVASFFEKIKNVVVTE